MSSWPLPAILAPAAPHQALREEVARARATFEKAKTYYNAVCLQYAERKYAEAVAARRAKLEIVK